MSLPPVRLLFSFRGRVGRLAFLAGYFGALALAMAVGGVLLAMLKLAGAAGMLRDEGVALGVGFVAGLASLGVAVSFFWPLLALVAKRHRSVGLPGWSGPAALVCILGAGAALRDGQPHAAFMLATGLSSGWAAALALWPERSTRSPT